MLFCHRKFACMPKLGILRFYLESYYVLVKMVLWWEGNFSSRNILKKKMHPDFIKVKSAMQTPNPDVQPSIVAYTFPIKMSSNWHYTITDWHTAKFQTDKDVSSKPRGNTVTKVSRFGQISGPEIILHLSPHLSLLNTSSQNDRTEIANCPLTYILFLIHKTTCGLL